MISALILIAMLVAYFLPTVVANHRQHKNTTAIFFSNLFFGWTGIGWLAVFVWATTANVKSRGINHGL